MQTNRYNRILKVVVIALIAVAVILSVLLYAHGPRIRLITYDKDPKTTAYNQDTMITINFDRPLAQSDYTSQISFTPELSFTTRTVSQNIVITLKESMLHETDYTLKVGAEIYDQSGKRMRGEYQEKISTGVPKYAYLVRNGTQNENGSWESPYGESDHIVISELGGRSESVFSHADIVSFASNHDYIVAVTREDIRDQIYTINLTTKEVRKERLMSNDEIRDITLSPRGLIALFSTIPDYDSVSRELYQKYANLTYSLNIETGEITKLTKSNGEAIKSTSISMDSTGQAALIKDEANTFYAVSPFNDSDPVRLGIYNDTLGFSSSGEEIIFKSLVGLSSYKIATGESKPITYNVPGYLQNYTSNGRSTFISSLSYEYGESSSDIYKINSGLNDKKKVWSSDSAGEIMRDFSVSYDNSLLSIHMNPLSCNYDQLNPNSQCAQAHTLIYDIESGMVLEDMPGFDLTWLP